MLTRGLELLTAADYRILDGQIPAVKVDVDAVETAVFNAEVLVEVVDAPKLLLE